MSENDELFEEMALPVAEETFAGHSCLSAVAAADTEVEDE
ncbi:MULTISPECIES: azolemycin family RiPP peptide [unclassified Streptomyces]